MPWNTAKRVTVIALAAMACAMPAALSAQTIAGTPTALDGDTLDFGGSFVDLAGIDAPEAAQTCMRDGESWTCGAEAKAFLQGFITDQQIVCTLTGASDNGVPAAVCTRGTLDLGQIVIEAGMALVPGEAPAAYTQAQSLREQHRIGIWASDFEHPAEWRAANPQAVAQARAAAQPPREPRYTAAATPDGNQTFRNSLGCAIKGNRSRRGEWIYHLPGMAYYDQTRPEELFCTEAAARRAGYRRSKE